MSGLDFMGRWYLLETNFLNAKWKMLCGCYLSSFNIASNDADLSVR